MWNVPTTGSPRQINKFLGVVGFAAATVALANFAAAEVTPRFEGSAAIEIQNDWNYNSDDLGNQHNQLFTKIEPEARFHFTPALTLTAHAVIEPVRDPDPREDRFFEDQGAFIEDLFLHYQAGMFAFRGGKFTPGFGLAWDIAPGIYGTDFAEAGYEFAERIGVLTSATFGADRRRGTHVLSAHAFFLDTSVLGQSIGRGRGATDRDAGGVSNTENLTSYAITLDGENVAAVQGLSYRLAYIRQAPGVTEQSDEKGFAAGIAYQVDLGAGISLSPFVEYVHFDDAEGVSNQNRDFLTLAGALDWKAWNLSVSYTSRDTKMDGSEDVEDFQFQTSVEYRFAFGLAVSLGWYIGNEGGIETSRVGALLGYSLDF
jgi:Gram-negative porin